MSSKTALFGSLFSTPQKNGLTRPKAVRGSGIPMVNMGELFAYPRIKNLAMDLVTLSEGEAHFLLEPEDLLFARQSLVLAGAGQCSIFVENTKPTAFESHLIRCRLNKSTSNPYFYFYYFRSPAGRSAIETIAEQGAGASGIRGSDLVKLSVPCPPKIHQDAVAKVLTAIDDRISLLIETNATLEAIAQTLFKSWFVDFDPVHSKIDGRVPEGMDEATAALFPGALDESELGVVPKGWRIEKLASACSYLNRGISPKYTEDGGVVVINQKCIRDHAVDLKQARRHDPKQRKVDGRELNIGDVLVNSTGVGTLGRVAQILHIVEPCIVDSHVTVVRPGPRISWPYLGQWMMRKQPDIEAMGEGSTGQTELNRSKLGELLMLVPTSNLLHHFDDTVRPLKLKASANSQQANNLAVLRDTLLPRLISGQLRISEATEALMALAA
jgi:type I restriction enzyme, S subunit